MLETKKKARIIKKFARKKGDVGSPEVQIALLTERIKELTGHFNKHPKDTNSKRGFMVMIGKRRRLLSYLKRKDFSNYRKLIAELGLRK